MQTISITETVLKSEEVSENSLLHQIYTEALMKHQIHSSKTGTAYSPHASTKHNNF